MWNKEGERGKGMGKGGPAQQDGGASKCVCPKCGYTTKHDRGTPCSSRECPKCKDVKLVGK